MADDEEEEAPVQENKGREAVEQQRAAQALGSEGVERMLDEKKASHAVKQALANFNLSQAADKEAARQRERELAAVKVDGADVSVLATEMEVDVKLAERRLKEKGGDLRQALKSFM